MDRWMLVDKCQCGAINNLLIENRKIIGKASSKAPPKPIIPNITITVEKPPPPPPPKEPTLLHHIDRELSEFKFSSRAQRVFVALDVKTVIELALLNPRKIKKVRNVGRKTLEEIESFLQSLKIEEIE